MTTGNQHVPVALGPSELRVDAVRVINTLKQRLAEEISKSVVLEAALAESQERERALAMQLAEKQFAADQPG